MWCPPVISWFISPMKTIVLSTINHSYWSYKPTYSHGLFPSRTPAASHRTCRGLDLLHIYQVLLQKTAVATVGRMAPRHHSAVLGIGTNWRNDMGWCWIIMALLWHYYGIAMALSWHQYGIIMALLWHYYGLSLHCYGIIYGIIMEYHGIIMALLWHYCGILIAWIIIALLWHYYGLSWHYYDIIMALLWHYYGLCYGLSWHYYGI